MAVRTLNSTWKQFEKLSEKCLQPKTAKAAQKPLQELVDKVNESKLVDALFSLLVEPHDIAEGCSLRFDAGDAKGIPEWETHWNAEAKTLLVNPAGVFRFYQDCLKAPASLNSPASRGNFATYRLQAFMAELGKMPSKLGLFLLILKQVAVTKEITRADKRSEDKEASGVDDYMNLLWAFKELETFYNHTTGLSIRTEHRLLWYESEWIAGK